MRSPEELLRVVTESVSERVPIDQREAASKAHILAALRDLPAPFDEHAQPEHVTGSAIVVARRGVLLLVHRLLGTWMQPGGHLAPGEAPWEAAIREAEEETGVTVRHPDGGPRLVHVDVHDAANGHTHLDLRYVLHGADEDPSPAPHESQEVRWFGWDEAYEVADASLAGALRSVRN